METSAKQPSKSQQKSRTRRLSVELRQQARSRKESDKALPARLRLAKVTAAGRNQHTVVGADQQGIDTSFVTRLDLLEPRIEFIQIHLDIGYRISPQLLVALRRSAMHSNPLGRVNGLINSRQQGNQQTRNTCHIGARSKPPSKSCTPRKALNQAKKGSKPSPKPRMQFVTHCIALGIDPSFVKGAVVDLFGLLAHELDIPMDLAPQPLAAEESAQAKVLGCVVQVRQSVPWRVLGGYGNGVALDKHLNSIKARHPSHPK